jgi:signal transduction histidine kinase
MTHALAVGGYRGRVNGGSRRWQLGVDLAICGALLAFSVPYTMSAEDVGAGTDLDTILLPAVVLPILLRRRAPLAAAAALAAGCIVSGIPTFEQFRIMAAFPAGMLISYSLGTRLEQGRALAGVALVLAGVTFVGFTETVLDDDGGGLGMALLAIPLCIGVWLGGRFVRSRELLAAELDERSRLLEQRRDETARLAVDVERTLLESDIDAAARASVQEIIELAATGERALDTDAARARAALARVEQLAHETLNAMRGLLGALRSDERADAPPPPARALVAPADTPVAETRVGGRGIAGGQLEVHRADVALAAALTFVSLVTVFARPGVPSPVLVAMAVVLLGALIAVRRSHPVQAACLSAVILLVSPTRALEDTTPIGVVILYSCGVYASRRAGLLAIAALMVCAQLKFGFDDFPWNTAINLLALVPPWWVGRQVRSRRELVSALAERNRELQAAEEELTRLSVRRERARVAHELHDVVGHHLAVIAVQARAGQVALAGGDTAVRTEALAAIRESGRQALDDMLRLVDLLKADGDEGGARLKRLPALLDLARAGGLDVHFAPLDPTVQLSSEVEETAFRVVQEAVTNAIKYAPGAEVDVRLAVVDDSLEVGVRDTGAARQPAVAATGSSLGLAGMSDRVESCGGSLVTGPQEGGGWRVHARLPLGPAGQDPHTAAGSSDPATLSPEK